MMFLVAFPLFHHKHLFGHLDWFLAGDKVWFKQSRNMSSVNHTYDNDNTFTYHLESLLCFGSKSDDFRLTS